MCQDFFIGNKTIRGYSTTKLKHSFAVANGTKKKLQLLSGSLATVKPSLIVIHQRITRNSIITNTEILTHDECTVTN